jgi:phage FluMu gp28-like protein
MNEIKQLIENQTDLSIMCSLAKFFLCQIKDSSSSFTVRAYFQKKILKDSEFWLVSIMKEFLQYKAMEKNTSVEKFTLKTSTELLEMKIRIIFSFFKSHSSFLPYNFDMKEVKFIFL